MFSIVQSEKKCLLCGRTQEYGFNRLELHHVFGGSNRKHSDRLGLTVWLCGDSCHRNGPNSVHKNRQVDMAVKGLSQKKFEENHTREEFREIFGKSWL